MRRFFLFLLLAFFAIKLSAQNTDIILLKTSEVVRGTITDSIPGVSVSIIALPDSNLRVIPREEIVKVILKKEQSQKKTKKQRAKELAEEENGIPNYYQAYFRAGFIGKGNDGNTSFLKADIINSIGINGVFTAGIGVGVRYPTDGEGAVIPLFADLRATFIQGNISPVLSFSAGAAFQTYEDTDDVAGIFMNPEVGIRLGSAYTTHLMITFGIEQFDYYGIGDRTTFFGNVIRDAPVKKELNAWTLSLLIGF